MVTVHDILLDADAFRAAYPHWPGAEPVGVVTGQGEYPCTAEHPEGTGWLRCNLESGHTEPRHLDGRTGREWDGPVTEPAEEPCPDCLAPAGRFCYPDCPRYAEGV